MKTLETIESSPEAVQAAWSDAARQASAESRRAHAQLEEHRSERHVPHYAQAEKQSEKAEDLTKKALLLGRNATQRHHTEAVDAHADAKSAWQQIAEEAEKAGNVFEKNTATSQMARHHSAMGQHQVLGDLTEDKGRKQLARQGLMKIWASEMDEAGEVTAAGTSEGARKGWEHRTHSQALAHLRELRQSGFRGRVSVKHDKDRNLYYLQRKEGELAVPKKPEQVTPYDAEIRRMKKYGTTDMLGALADVIYNDKRARKDFEGDSPDVPWEDVVGDLAQSHLDAYRRHHRNKATEENTMNETVQAGDAKLAEIKAAGTSEGVRKSWLKRHATFNTHKQDMGSHEDWDMSKDEFDALKRRHGQTVAIKDIAVTVDESDPESHNYTVRFSDGHEAQVPGSLLDVHSNAPAGPHRVGSPRKNEHGEWVVPWFENGKRHEGRTYYTDSKDDAHDTHKHMSAMADKLNQESAAKASEFAEEGAVHCRDSGIVFADDQKWEVDKEVSFQWMPGGVTTMRPSYNGRPIHLTVRCDEKTAKVVQSSFEAWRKKYPKQEPFGCVEHREQEAAIRPNGFEWRNEPEPGVFCSARPTELGARNVNGRIHRSWSPSFRTDAEYDKCTCKDCRLSAAECQCGGDLEFPDGARGSASNPAEVIGVAFSVGSLTNKPAFKNILPVRAREEGEKDDEIKATGTSEGVRKAWETRARHLARTAHAASSKAYEHPGDSMLHREATEAHRAAAEHYRKAAHVDKAYEHKADWHERLADMHSRSAEDFEAGERKNESHVTSSDAILAEVAKERQKALESFEQSTPLTADAIFASLSGMK